MSALLNNGSECEGVINRLVVQAKIDLHSIPKMLTL